MIYPEVLMRLDPHTGLTSHAKGRFLRRSCASSNQRTSKMQSETRYRLEEIATRWPALRAELPRRTMACQRPSPTEPCRSSTRILEASPPASYRATALVLRRMEQGSSPIRSEEHTSELQS